MPTLLLALAVSVLLAGTAAAQTGAVEITNAWARATPGGAENGAAYVTIESATPDRLAGVETPVAKKAELHEMKTENGIAKMRPLGPIDLPAGQPVTLKPGGMHIMLMGLKQQLRPGQSFPLTLHFARAGDREVSVAVEKVGAMRMGDHGGARMPTPMPMPMPMGH